MPNVCEVAAGFISAAEVSDFVILKNLVPVGRDANQRTIIKADRTKMTIQDVIAADGAHLPDFDHSQRKLNTGIAVVVEHGQSPQGKLIQRANAIRLQWIDYWEITTGRGASMTATPR